MQKKNEQNNYKKYIYIKKIGIYTHKINKKKSVKTKQKIRKCNTIFFVKLKLFFLLQISHLIFQQISIFRFYQHKYF